MKDKQTDNIIKERCKILGKLVEKIGNLNYNGAMVQTSEDFYIPASKWELRFDGNYSCNEGTIVFSALEQAITEDETFKANEGHGHFLAECLNEPGDKGWQMAYLVAKDNVEYIISIILRWHCRNWYIMEYEILPFKVPLGNYGLLYYFNMLCKKNWSKLHLPFGQITYRNKVISYLPTNEVVDVPQIVKQIIEEQKESNNKK